MNNSTKTGPVLAVAEFRHEQYYDGSTVAVCLTQADTFWPALFFILSLAVFFFVPLLVLVALYTVIARHLMTHAGIIANNNNTAGSQALRYRKQVVLMLGTVVLSFFVCLLPFRAFILWIIVAPTEHVMALGVHAYYNLLYFCRIMLYLNSAVNPILYNLMSSKFRGGFVRLCGLRRKGAHGRKGTFNTTSTATTACSGGRPSPDSFWRRSTKKSACGSVRLLASQPCARLPSEGTLDSGAPAQGTVARDESYV